MSHIIPGSSDPTNPFTPDEFDRLMAQVPMVSPWEAMFTEAEEMLAEAHPEGFDVLDIGREAFDSLPESEKEEALDVLFYAYWSARELDRETLARHEAKGGTR